MGRKDKRHKQKKNPVQGGGDEKRTHVNGVRITRIQAFTDQNSLVKNFGKLTVL